MTWTLFVALALLAGGCTVASLPPDRSGASTASPSCPGDTTVLALVDDWNTAVVRAPTEPDLSDVRSSVDALVQQDPGSTCRGAGELTDLKVALDRVTSTTDDATPADWQDATGTVEVYLVALGISPSVLAHPEVQTPPGFPAPPLETGASTALPQP